MARKLRIPQPHWKKSHACWYVKLNGKFERLDPDRDKATAIYTELINRHQVADGLANPRSITVRDLLYSFLDWTKKHNAKDTYKWYRKYIHGTDGKAKGSKYSDAGFANFVTPRLLVNDLKKYHLENWLDARYPNVSDNTKAGAITAILRAFNWAKDQGYIKESPLGRVKKPMRRGRGEEAYLKPEQWEQLVEAIREGNHDVQPFLDYATVIKETGCRPQEIRIVEAHHIDHVAKRWVFPVKQNKTGKKTGEKRIVLLGETAYQICRRLALKCPEGPLFRNADGKPWTASAVADRCKRLSEKLGFRVFAYQIRHTFATEAIINGADVITVARLMGHKDLTMLNRIYQHIMQDQKHMEDARRKATERMAV